MRCRPLDQTARDPAADVEVVAVMRDITERKSQEQALEEARSEAEKAHAAKSQFLATMSHELQDAAERHHRLLGNDREGGRSSASTPRAGTNMPG